MALNNIYSILLTDFVITITYSSYKS